MEYLKLSDCATYSNKRTKSISIETYISTENMLPNKGGITKIDSIPDCFSTSKYEVGDILLSNIRPYFQKIWFATREGGCSNDVLVLKAKKGVDVKFLYYVLSDSNFFNYDTITSKGTKMPRGSKSAIMKYTVPNFPLPTQRKIASILSAYDNLIECNSKRIRLLEQMAENLYKEWFVRFRFPGHQNVKMVDGLPEGWKRCKAEEIFDIKIGRTPSRKNFEYFSTEPSGNHSWVSIADMRDCIFIDKTSEYLTDDAICACNMPMVAPNTVLLSFKLTVGKVAIATTEVCTNEAIAHFNTSNPLLREYTYLYLKTFNYGKLGNTSAIGNAINSTIVKNMPFEMPDEKILKYFYQVIKPIFNKTYVLTEQNRLLTRQRDLLLPRLMSGKLEVK